MAIRRVTVADIPTIVSWWDAHRAAAEYVREQGLDPRNLALMIGDDANVMLIDPDTLTLSIGQIEGTAGHVHMLFSRRTGTAGVRAADQMFAAVAQGAIDRGLTLLYGEYVFPAGLDVATTRVGKYFDSLTPCVKTSTIVADGQRVRYEAAPAPLLAALLARLL